MFKKSLPLATIFAFAAMAFLTPVGVRAEEHMAMCTNVLAERATPENPYSIDSLGLRKLEALSVSRQLSGIEKQYGHDVAVQAAAWCASGHGFFSSLWWDFTGHNYGYSASGHSTSTSTQWANQGHSVATTKQWGTTGHNFDWSFAGHSADLTQKWQDIGHTFAMTQANHSHGSAGGGGGRPDWQPSYANAPYAEQ